MSMQTHRICKHHLPCLPMHVVGSCLSPSGLIHYTMALVCSSPGPPVAHPTTLMSFRPCPRPWPSLRSRATNGPSKNPPYCSADLQIIQPHSQSFLFRTFFLSQFRPNSCFLAPFTPPSTALSPQLSRSDLRATFPVRTIHRPRASSSSCPRARVPSLCPHTHTHTAPGIYVDISTIFSPGETRSPEPPSSRPFLPSNYSLAAPTILSRPPPPHGLTVSTQERSAVGSGQFLPPERREPPTLPSLRPELNIPKIPATI